MKYDLSHLIQQPSQEVWGPIQDDEALLLFSLIRVTLIRNIVEIGGLHGYSARNFLRSLPSGGKVYTIDIHPVSTIDLNHKVITKSAADVLPQDLDNQPLDLVFFDAHAYDAELAFFNKFYNDYKLITDDTVLVLHDTNLHFHRPEHPEGFAHQTVERSMVNEFKKLGYDIINLHTKKHLHSPNLPFRHGLSICQKFKILE